MDQSVRTPAIFIGHGSPMNAIQENDFTRMLNGMRSLCRAPQAVLCISAHWMTEGTWVTGMEKPKTIHDFYGFPQELFEVQYPAPGAPKLAEQIAQESPSQNIHNTTEMWGLDHGTWSVLRHVYPEAEIPVLQLSLHMEKPPEYHYQMGTELRRLREMGVLIVGSGNVVHNLRTLDWSETAEPFDWAIEYDQWIKEKLIARDFSALTKNFRDSAAGKLSVPTTEHYLPLLYVLGASDEQDELHFEFEEIHNSSISMRTLSFR